MNKLIFLINQLLKSPFVWEAMIVRHGDKKNQTGVY